MAEADLFVVMDDLQYEPQNFQNRNRVKLNHGPQWLTVPLERGPQDERIVDKRIVNRGSPKEHWQRKTWQTLSRSTTARRRSGALRADELRSVFTRPWERLVDLQLHLLRLHLRWFEIYTPIVRASSLALRGHKTDRLESLCLAVGADVYLSGGGGSRGYLDVEQLARAGVRVDWQRFAHPVYPQRYPMLGFKPEPGVARPAPQLRARLRAHLARGGPARAAAGRGGAVTCLAQRARRRAWSRSARTPMTSRSAPGACWRGWRSRACR